MGGSGGGYFKGGSDPGDLARRLREAELSTVDADYEARVNQDLGDSLKAFNDRDVAATRELLRVVEEELGDEIGGAIDLVFGGSVSRRTYLEGLSDTDALVLLKQSDVGRDSPEALKERLAARLRDRFGADCVKIGNLAVTITTKGKELQLLPAIRDGDGYRISTPEGKTWSRINPRAFAEKLTQANGAQDRKLIPTIKLAKAMIATLPRQQQIEGYHLESMAIEAFTSYSGARTYKAMVTHFFERAAELVRSPIRDRTGQSVHVDEYLGDADSAGRRLASQALQRLHRKLLNADASKNVQAWAALIPGE
jgi:hypothetical protein